MCTPLHLKWSSILGFQRFFKRCFERKRLSCDLFWQFVVRDQLAHSCLTFTKVFSLTGKGCALQCDLISSFYFNYLRQADIFPWPLSSARRTAMARAYSDGHSKCLCTFSPHQVCMSALWPEGEPLTNAGCCLQIKPAGKKKKQKKLAHFISHSSLGSPCFIAFSGFNSCPRTRCLINVHILCKRK